MSNNESPNQGRPRRASVGNTVLTNLFQRGNSTSAGAAVFPNTSANMNMNDAQRRRLSISTSTLGLHGSPPTNPVPFGLRRGSMSANSDSIDENAVDDDDSPSSSARTAPNTPFTRHMSFGAQTMWYRGGGGGSPGSGNDPAVPPNTPAGPVRRSSTHQASRMTVDGSPAASAAGGSFISAALSSARRRSGGVAVPQAQASSASVPRTPSDMFAPRPDQQGFNWSEQLRNRAESSVSGARPSFPLGPGLSSSPPRAGANQHDRQKSVSDMPAPPPAQAAKPKPPQRQKPDAFQERILKGDFYMD